MKYTEHGTEGFCKLQEKPVRPLMSFPIYQKKVNQKKLKGPKLLAIPVMYRTCSILGLAMFDIIRQYTEIKLSYPCPKLAMTKNISSGSRHRKVSVKK